MAETTEVLEEKKVKVKEREPLFSKKNKKLISDPLDENNPVTIQVLGICSALAVTVQTVSYTHLTLPTTPYV